MKILPDGWGFAEIDEVISEQNGGKRIHQGWSPQCEKEPCDSPEQWGVLKTTAIQAGEFQWQHHKKLPGHLKPRVQIEVFPGDLLLTCAGPRIRCGVACLVRNTRPKLMLSGKIYRFRAAKNVADERYLESFLQTQEAQSQIDAMKTGGSDSGLNLTHERFKKLRLNLAPYLEQIRIVAKLEELLSDLDAGVAELKVAQKKLAQYRQSLLKAAVDGSLTAEWRKNTPPTETGAQLLERILKERRTRWEEKQLAKFQEQGKTPPKDWQKKYPDPANPETSDAQLLPETWGWATVDQLTIEQKYGSSAKTDEENSGIPVLRMGNIQDGQLDYSNLKYLPCDHDEFPALHLLDGDLLFNRTNSPELVGKTAVYRSEITPCSYASYLISVRFNESFIPELASTYINSAYGRHWIKSVVVQQVGQANVNGTKLAALSVPLPPRAEQEEIIRLLTMQLSIAFEQETNIGRSLKQAAAQRQNILRAAFAGQLVPQDPNDEPASVLLERIRAERAAKTKPKARGRKKAVPEFEDPTLSG